jgi:iron complex outermembrane recepter protein
MRTSHNVYYVKSRYIRLAKRKSDQFTSIARWLLISDPPTLPRNHGILSYLVNRHRCVTRLTELPEVLLMALVPALAVAQTPPSVEANAALAAEPQEITVTARRRSEDISNVPISITALDSNQLAEQEVHTQSDLQVSVPGLIVRTTAVSTQQNYSIRGQSIDAFTGSSPAVLAYVNDVEANTGVPTTFFDLSSIQVLKGPQGTLFGRNTTGGAVLYTTAKPENSLGGFATERLGNLGLTETIAAINLPVSDKVLLRLAGDLYDRDGYQRDVETNQVFGGLNRKSGRATLMLKPIDGLENETVSEYGSSSGHPTINTPYSYYPCGTVPGGHPTSSTRGRVKLLHPDAVNRRRSAPS